MRRMSLEKRCGTLVVGGGVMELDERIDQLETDLAQIKVDIKEVLVDLKELILRDKNPLAEQIASD